MRILDKDNVLIFFFCFIYAMKSNYYQLVFQLEKKKKSTFLILSEYWVYKKSELKPLAFREIVPKHRLSYS